MITVEFKDFEDMMGFARSLVLTVETKTPAVESPMAVQPAPPPVQQSQVPTAAPPQAASAASVPTYTAPVTPPPTQPAPPVTQPVPTTAASYTADDLARAATTLMDSGRQGELLVLLAQFGVDSLVSLQPAQYGAFATALRGLGAQI